MIENSKKESSVNRLKASKLKWLHDLHDRISNLPNVLFILLMFILAHVMAAITSPLYDFFIDYESFDNSYFGLDFYSTFFSTVITSPILETILAQYLPIEICIFLYKKSQKFETGYIFIAILSAAFFGLAHYPAYADIGGTIFGIIRVINTFSTGLVLAYTYLVYKLKAGRAVIATTILHMMFNFSVIMLPIFYALIGLN